LITDFLFPRNFFEANQAAHEKRARFRAPIARKNFMDKRTPVTFLLLQDKTGQQARILESLSTVFTNEVLVFNQDMSIIRYLSQEVKNVGPGNYSLPFVIVLCPSLNSESSAEILDTIIKDDRQLVRKTPVFTMTNPNSHSGAVIPDRDLHGAKTFDMDLFLDWLGKLRSLKMEMVGSGKRMLHVDPVS
jgi:hypothetical protein